MKKFFAVLTATTLAVSMLVGCGSAASSQAASSEAASSQAVSSQAASSQAASSESADAGEQTALYVVTNSTGETVTELYIYEAGAEEKGDNYAGEGLAADGKTEVSFTAASAKEVEGKNYVIEFTTEGGDSQKFETLHFEQATIELLSVDAAAGATPVVFGAVEQ